MGFLFCKISQLSTEVLTTFIWNFARSCSVILGQQLNRRKEQKIENETQVSTNNCSESDLSTNYWVFLSTIFFIYSIPRETISGFSLFDFVQEYRVDTLECERVYSRESRVWKSKLTRNGTYDAVPVDLTHFMRVVSISVPINIVRLDIFQSHNYVEGYIFIL